jgi:hypothetical protein
MKKLTIKVLEAMFIILYVSILALTIPLILSSIVVLLTSVTYTDCFTSPLFWILFILCIIDACAYINDEIKNL